MYLVLRDRVSRLEAKRRHRRPRVVRTAVQLRSSNRELRRSIETLQSRVRHLKRQVTRGGAGITPAVRGTLERIAACESHGNPRAIGGGGAFRGKYQFTYGTWRAIGGRGDPASAPEAEQDRLAVLLLRRSGSAPWPVCG